MNTFIISTPKHRLEIRYYHGVIHRDDVKVNKEQFEEMCKNGCPNYGKKYTCPPYSPSYTDHTKGNDWLFVVAFTLSLDQFKNTKYREYLKLRIANSVLKTRIEKLMRAFEKQLDSKFLGTGACRLCKPCQLQSNEPCRYPQERRYSLESVGVDCNELMKKVCGKELKWYRDKKAPQYTSVICALPVKERGSAYSLRKSLLMQIRKIS
ncbi:MAG: DUF2284 domain-containing protein [Candidatus Dojkabacteria bacterium]|jgi:predicted metal-binding protein|nr:DUF2284 domain-containing protein [Candidatus Dojkabacteria bacterium]